MEGEIYSRLFETLIASSITADSGEMAVCAAPLKIRTKGKRIIATRAIIPTKDNKRRIIITTIFFRDFLRDAVSTCCLVFMSCISVLYQIFLSFSSRKTIDNAITVQKITDRSFLKYGVSTRPW